MISVKEARASIASRVRALPSEIVALDDALGRYLSADAVAPRSLPPRDNSAMDGFAVRAEDTPGDLPVAQVIAAGRGTVPTHRPGTATPIMTGAPMPEGADSVVMRENVVVRAAAEGQQEGVASFKDSAILARHIRRAGEDIKVGTVALTAGVKIGPGEIGLLAALGFSQIEVARRPRVAILSTGDELIDVSDSRASNPPPGKIINSNAYALAAQIRQAGGEPIHCGIARDSLAGTTVAIAAAIANADVLLTSGGVSVGDFDFVKPALTECGVVTDFWKVAVKPGKPLVFGVHPSGSLVFGLPGNPASSMVSFELFVRPALLALQSARTTKRREIRVFLESGYKKTAGRTHYLRVRVSTDGGERRVARIKPKQGSGNLTTMAAVDGLVEIPSDVTSVAAGEAVSLLILN